MNFFQLHNNGRAIKINFALVEEYYPAHASLKKTSIRSSSGAVINVDETPEQIDGIISGMGAFGNHVAGSTFHDTKPTLDEKTRLLIEALVMMAGAVSWPDGWKQLADAIRKAVGEGALAQYAKEKS
jgi:hypothetical protein